MRRIIAAAIVRGDKFLIAKRNYGSLAGYWEFPGGKVEDKETDEECIKREILEEFAVKIKVEEFLGEQNFLADGKEYIMALYKTILIENSLQLNVHSEIAWVAKEQLRQYKMAPVDILLIQKGCLEDLI